MMRVDFFPDDSEIVVEVDGYIFKNWKTVKISRSMGNVIGSAQLTLAVADDIPELELLSESAEVIIYADSPDQRYEGQHLMVGYIMGVSDSIGNSGRTISIDVKDKTIDLVQCSAIVPSSSWSNSTLERIAKDICKPFDIFVTGTAVDFKAFSVAEYGPRPTELYEKPFNSFTINSGETAFATIERACRARGVIALTDNWGNLVLDTARIDYPRAATLEVGRNVYGVSKNKTWDSLYHEYTCYGQVPSGGKGWGPDNTTANASARDDNIYRYRPLNFQIESNAKKDVLQTRANWEAQVRNGRSQNYTATVPGWFDNLGSESSARLPFSLNTNVNLVVDRWNLDERLMITGLSFDLTEGGRSTTLSLSDPSTYASDPGSVVQEKKKKKKKKT
jgi:prophage tail gpP-like protein